jgi:hypothetical protein
MFAFVSEGSPVRGLLKSFVRGRPILLCATAEAEFRRIIPLSGGPLEQARAVRLLARVTRIPDGPSPRAAALRPTGNLESPDIIIFGTGDALGVITATSDAKAVRAAAAQGVAFNVFLHPPAPLTGR